MDTAPRDDVSTQPGGPAGVMDRQEERRAAETLREEMEYLGPAKRSVVEAKQQEIVDVIRKLEDSGEIDLNAINEQEELVQ